MLYKPTEHTPNLWDISLDPTVRNPVLATICIPHILPDACSQGNVLGMLLYGPPGCGKSLILKLAAKEYGLTLSYVDISSVLSKRQGEGEK